MCVESIAPITLGKPAPAENCALLLACWNLLYLLRCGQFPHSAGLARLRVDRHGPNRLASALHSNDSRSSPHSSRRIALGNLKQLMSQPPSRASKSSLSLNTSSLRIAPFAKSSNAAKAASVVNGIHCTTLRMLLYPLI